MAGEKRKQRFQGRLEKLKAARTQTVSARKKIVAASVACGVTVLTMYLVFATLGIVALDWQFGGMAAGLGACLGWTMGVKTVSGGVAAGLFAGIWISLEISFWALAVALEMMLAAVGAVLAFCGSIG